MVLETHPREYPKKSRIGLIYAGGIPKGASPLCVVAGGGSQEGDTIESVPLLSVLLPTFPTREK